MLEYLVSKGFNMTITSLKCGHSYMSSSGYVSEHSTGDAVDIAVIDGVPVTGHQGPGTLADELIRTVLQLQGTMHPHQVISLEDLPGETSFALPDHYDHVHSATARCGPVRPAVQRAAETRAVGPTDPSARPDRKPRSPDLGLGFRCPTSSSRPGQGGGTGGTAASGGD